MVGTALGGKHAAKTMKEKYGEDYYKKLGEKGGVSRINPGGFASLKEGSDGMTGKERAKVYGKIGGLIGRRGYKFIRLLPNKGTGLYRNKTTGEELILKVNGLGE